MAFAQKNRFLCGSPTTTGQACRVPLVTGTCQFHGTLGPGSRPFMEGKIEPEYSLDSGGYLDINSFTISDKDEAKFLSYPLSSSSGLIVEDCSSEKNDILEAFEYVTKGLEIQNSYTSQHDTTNIEEWLKNTDIHAMYLNGKTEFSFLNKIPSQVTVEQISGNLKTWIIKDIKKRFQHFAGQISSSVQNYYGKEHILEDRSFFHVQDIIDSFFTNDLQQGKKEDYVFSSSKKIFLYNPYNRITGNFSSSDFKLIYEYINEAAITSQYSRKLQGLRPLNSRSKKINEGFQTVKEDVKSSDRFKEILYSWTRPNVITVSDFICGSATLFYLIAAGGLEKKAYDKSNITTAEQIANIAAGVEVSMAAMLGGASIKQAWAAACVSSHTPIPPIPAS